VTDGDGGWHRHATINVLSCSLVVTNTLDSGAFRAKPQHHPNIDHDANLGVDPDPITFNIPGSGLKTISPTTALPTITDPVIIDGYTQPGASANTNAAGSGLGLNTVLQIELNGTSAGATASGLIISGGNSTVRGLVVNRFNRAGIL
jgi:hypothetical protein